MASVNKVILIGNLTRDPQTKHLPNQSIVTEFGLAMNRKFKGADGEEREEVCFVDVTAFGRQAEVVQKYCQKGKLLYVEGRLRYDSWEDKNGGGKRSKLTVVLENFQFLGGRDDAEGGGERQAPQRQTSGAGANFRHPPWQQTARPTEPPFGDGPAIPSDDIPFHPNVL